MCVKILYFKIPLFLLISKYTIPHSLLIILSGIVSLIKTPRKIFIFNLFTRYIIS
uniref:NADH:ubiquinone reductase (H(+)-translocating) n=1 Tax=Heterorhabditis bacteriophora TaxID=37862 RepID=A0A1I7WQQ4_HETBA